MLRLEHVDEEDEAQESPEYDVEPLKGRENSVPSEALLRTGSRGSSILRAGHLSRHSLKTGRTRSLCNITASMFLKNEV